MFTGIITGLGRISDSQALGEEPVHGKRLTIEAPARYLDDVQLGDSIALDGACMTVTSLEPAAARFTVDISAESLARTAGLDGNGRAAKVINLEKAVRANDRLGGHMVSGHVDGIGQVRAFDEVGESWRLRLLAPAELARFIAYKGSITVNGVSLTVNTVADVTDPAGAAGAADAADAADAPAGPSPGCELEINLIPHTLAHTSLGGLRPGDTVNLEIDLIARYVERMLTAPPRIR